MHPLTPAETRAELAGTPFVHLGGALRAAFRTADFAASAALLDQVARVADELNHHPDAAVGYGRITFTLSSHDAGGVTARDLRLAGRIRDLAAEAGAEPEKRVPSTYEIAIDAMDADAIRGFWRAGLDYQERPGDDGQVDLVDPRGVGPTVWFQQMAAARPDRNRIHLDVYVPAEHAKERVTHVVDAGGTVVTDEHAPDWWVLADVEGNELCVCTSSR